jgi:hypothetical protein
VITLNRNKQSLKYALQIGKVPIYETDDDGNIIYIVIDGNKVPVETGEYEIGYMQPVDFKANIAMSGGEAEAREFGLNLSDYNAVLLCDKNIYPISETSLIWHHSEVGYKDTDETIVNSKTADYSVVKVSESLNFVKYVLKKITK